MWLSCEVLIGSEHEAVKALLLLMGHRSKESDGTCEVALNQLAAVAELRPFHIQSAPRSCRSVSSSSLRSLSHADSGTVIAFLFYPPQPFVLIDVSCTNALHTNTTTQELIHPSDTY